ncbi:hypothetical protein GCM10010975_09640 [Comamonas phosphati]|nr:hypothetical protein GCM10010975_09640 [Comamonas phosphati]
MMMKSNALLFGIESSKGEFEGTKYDSTKFHLSVDLGQKSNGKTVGVVTRPFKLGDSTEIEKWEHLNQYMSQGKPIPVEAEFDVVASSDGVKLTLMSVKPATQASGKAAASAQA